MMIVIKEKYNIKEYETLISDFIKGLFARSSKHTFHKRNIIRRFQTFLVNTNKIYVK